MLQVYGLLTVCVLLAVGIKRQTLFEEKRGILVARGTSVGKLLFFFLIVILVMFAGLRTVMNDTGTYISSFRLKIPGSLEGIATIDWSIGSNPLFTIYQIVLKALLSSNGQVFIFITALITEVSMVRFLHRYSSNFGWSLYLFLAFTVFAFTMAAMKQAMATAIAIWSLPLYQQKRWWKATLLLLLAMMIHPYVIVFVSALFLTGKGVWNRRIYLVIVLTVLFALSFSTVLERVLNVTDMIGDEFQEEAFAEGTGVGIPRILSYLIVPVLAFFARRGLRADDNPIQNLFVNLSIVAACLSVLSGFGGSVLFGRMPNYFDLCICIALPYVLDHLDCLPPKFRGLLKLALPIAYLVFYQTYYHKYFSGEPEPLTADIYHHTTFLDMLANW